MIILSLTVATTVFVLNLTLPGEIVLKVQETLRSVYGESDLAVSSEDATLESIDFGEFGEDDMTCVDMYRLEIFVENKPALYLGLDIEKGKNLNLFGEDVPNLKENEVAMSKLQAEEYGYKEGDEIEFTVDDEEYKMKIVKIVDTKGLMAMEMEYVFFMGNPSQVCEIGEFEDEVSSLYIDVKDNDRVGELAKYLQENNEGILVNKLADIESIEASMSFVNYIMIMVFAMATIMIFFVVGSMNKVIIAERMPVIGTFRSVGATRGKMNAILLWENMLYGLIGGVLGCIFAYGINSNMAGLFVTTRGVSLSQKTSHISWFILAVGVAFAVLLEFFITIKAITKANKKPIKDIIFDVQSTRYIIRKNRLFLGPVMMCTSFVLDAINTKSNIGLTLASIVLLMVGAAYIVPLVMRGASVVISAIAKKIGWATGVIAGRNVGYSKMLISSARLVTVSVALMISILAASGSFAKLFESFRYIWDMDVIVQNLSETADKYDVLNEVDGVESVEYLYYYYGDDIYRADNKKLNDYPIMMGLEKSCKGVVEIDCNVEDMAYDEMFVDAIFAEKSGIEIGDSIELRIERKNKTIKYQVTGFVNSTNFTSSRNVCVIRLDNYLENISDIPVWAQIVAKEGTDLQKLKADCLEAVKEVGVFAQTFEEYIKEQEKQTSSIMSIFYVIIGMAVMLSFIGIINNLSIGFIQRRKEMAVLNSTCMSKGQLFGMMCTEVVLTNLIACVLGGITAFAATGMIDAFMESLSVYVKVEYDIKAALIVSGIIVILSLFTLFVPGKRLKKMSIVEEIKYE
ncbi:MAG: FtsX-like permease family protein [Lachnospiraceae bacterium]|nr:FtsX-like permease family protein [Lachnospiraceae bacterium]